MSSFAVTAPARVDLAGGTIDLWPIHCALGGAKTINVAINLLQSVDFAYSSDKKNSISLTGLDGATTEFSTKELPVDLPPTLKFPATLVFRKLQATDFSDSLEIKISSKIPPGSGLGGSSTLAVALIHGLNHLIQASHSPLQLMEEARDLEAEFLKVPTGTQDYLAAIHGGLRTYTFQNGRIDSFAHSSEALKELEDRFVIIYSGQSHESGKSNWEVFRGFMEKDVKIVSGLTEISQLSESLDQVLRQTSTDWNQVGQHLNRDWEIRRDVFGLSTHTLGKVLDLVDEQTGVLGRKVCGAAQGGCIVALLDPAHREEFVQTCLNKKLHILSTRPTDAAVSTKSRN